ncbi:hypothetical protein HDU81_000271 [Chytriomyces hyalinus]|nr:hypothetical protein HDU81_000271 [Chytriomyces hyalinus]
MGTNMAVVVANLDAFAAIEIPLMIFIKNNFIMYFRYIDDIIAVTSKDALPHMSILETFNNLHPTLKFTSSSNKQNIAYLDLDIKISDH